MKDLKEFPEEGYCESTDSRLINYLKSRENVKEEAIHSNAKGIAWNKTSYWSIISSTSKQEYKLEPVKVGDVIISDDNKYQEILMKPNKTKEESEATLKWAGEKAMADKGNLTSLEYITQSAYNESAMGLTDAVVNHDFRFNKELLNMYNPNWMEQGVSQLLSLTYDAPAFVGSAAVGYVGLRQGLKYATNRLIAKGFEEATAKKIVGNAAKTSLNKTLINAGEMGITFGGYNVQKDLLKQLE